jgi:hypothetical protein
MVMLMVLSALLPLQASARFGKSKRDRSARPPQSHAATPPPPVVLVPQPVPPPPPTGSMTIWRPWYACWDDPLCPYYYGWGWNFGYRPYFWNGPSNRLAPPPELVAQSQIRATFLVEGNTFVSRGGGGSAGLDLGVEKDRFGANVHFSGIFVKAEDEPGVTDNISLLSAHLTYAVFSGEVGKLRLGGGVDTAFAPDITLVGPGFSISGALGVWGPLGVESSLRVTPLPFIQLDFGAGATFSFGPVGLRLGWRHLLLNDNGHVDGVVHKDVFSGPSVAAAFAF